MREMIATILLLLIIGLLYFPQSTGVVAHKAFKEFKIGWDQVQP